MPETPLYAGEFTRAQQLRQSASYAVTKAVESIHANNYDQSRAWSALAVAHSSAEQAELQREQADALKAFFEAMSGKGGQDG